MLNVAGPSLAHHSLDGSPSEAVTVKRIKKWKPPSKAVQQSRSRREREEALFRETGYREIPDGMKQCRGCRKAKPVGDFYKIKYKSWQFRSEYRSRCKECELHDLRLYRHSGSGSEYHRNYRLIQRFGITASQYDEMLTRQGGACAICGTKHGKKNGTGRLSVDHDHKTGKIRGLLCLHCNVAIGKFGDSAALVRKAAEYLESNQEMINDAA